MGKKGTGLDDTQQEHFNKMLRVLAERVRKLRKSRAMSGRKLADEAGISHATLVLIEGGAINVSLLIIFQVANALKVDVGVLLDELSIASCDNSVEDSENCLQQLDD